MRSTGGAGSCRPRAGCTTRRPSPGSGDAGAIVFGKTNLPRWSGDVQSYNDLFGTTNNPWDLTGSRAAPPGGAAAAVAAGLTAFELGTDIGGSVRIPSHCCGTFGLKPSYGVVPQRGYLDSVGGGTTDADINVFGPMPAAPATSTCCCRCSPVRSRRGAGVAVDLPPAGASTLAGRRIAVWLDDPACPSDAAMLDVLRRAVDAISDAGARARRGPSAGRPAASSSGCSALSARRWR